MTALESLQFALLCTIPLAAMMGLFSLVVRSSDLWFDGKRRKALMYVALAALATIIFIASGAYIASQGTGESAQCPQATSERNQLCEGS